MLLQLLAFFTILSGANYFEETHPSNMRRTPQSINLYEQGDYFFINGTQGCPQSIQIQVQCNGFSLKPDYSSGVGETQYFCDINDKSKDQKYRHEAKGKKVLSVVTQTEDVIRRHLLAIYNDKTQELRIKTEDTLFIDPTGKILWEHSLNGQGFSCLFSK